MINHEEFSKILDSYDTEAIKEAAKSVFYDERNDFDKTLTVIECLNLGDEIKLEKCKLMKVFLGDIPAKDVKQIFSFDFWTNVNSVDKEES